MTDIDAVGYLKELQKYNQLGKMTTPANPSGFDTQFQCALDHAVRALIDRTGITPDKITYKDNPNGSVTAVVTHEDTVDVSHPEEVRPEDFDWVMDFISHFKGAEDIFLNDMCYWFAWILSSRFALASIWYDQIEGHFITKISDYFFDVRGNVTDRYKYSPGLVRWDDLKEKDPSLFVRVTIDCVVKIPSSMRDKFIPPYMSTNE